MRLHSAIQPPTPKKARRGKRKKMKQPLAPQGGRDEFNQKDYPPTRRPIQREPSPRRLARGRGNGRGKRFHDGDTSNFYLVRAGHWKRINLFSLLILMKQIFALEFIILNLHLKEDMYLN